MRKAILIKNTIPFCPPYTTYIDGGRAGVNTVSWNGKSLFGETAGNGMYLYKIVTKNRVLAKRQARHLRLGPLQVANAPTLCYTARSLLNQGGKYLEAI